MSCLPKLLRIYLCLSEVHTLLSAFRCSVVVIESAVRRCRLALCHPRIGALCLLIHAKLVTIWFPRSPCEHHVGIVIIVSVYMGDRTVPLAFVVLMILTEFVNFLVNFPDFL